MIVMFKKPYSSGGHSSQGHGTKSGSGFNSFRSGGSRRSFRGRGRVEKKLDVSRFINKTIVTEIVEEFVPQHKFQDFAITPALKANIVKKGYLNPTPIQDKTIPVILEGKDVVGIANTGTGKTAAFLIPFIHKVLLDRKERVLILVPTRELGLQIQDEFIAFTKTLGLQSVLCIGGAGIGPQIHFLKRHPHFVIATPGRLKDLIQRKCIDLSNFHNIVLDEADRMLDMGFIHDIKYLLGFMPEKRHSLFFSATISPEVQNLIKDFLHNPVVISVKSRDTAANVEQDIIRVPDKSKKMELLHDLLIKSEFSKVLIFGKTKHGVEKLTLLLAKRGFKVESIHGNKTQSRRQKALNLFKANHVQILVATDVAARGLDIADVSHVINFDVPATYEDYIHRIGRTGRADKKGKALTFVD